MFCVEDLRNGRVEELKCFCFTFYRDKDLDGREIFTHVLSSETGMVVARLPRIKKTDGVLFVAVRWKGLLASDDTLEPIPRVHKDVPDLLRTLLD